MRVCRLQTACFPPSTGARGHLLQLLPAHWGSRCLGATCYGKCHKTQAMAGCWRRSLSYWGAGGGQVVGTSHNFGRFWVFSAAAKCREAKQEELPQPGVGGLLKGPAGALREGT